MEILRRILDRARLRTLSRPARLVLAGVPLVALVLGFYALSATFSVSCPPDTACVTLRGLRDGEPLPEAIQIVDRNGVLLAEVAGPLRKALHRDSIPDFLKQAFVTVEDRRFFNHNGVDGRGVLRAAFRNVAEGGISEGASTIPMQLVRTLWAESLSEVGPWRRKIIEARTAPRLVEELGRDRVLELYLNSIYLGNGLYGVERAARYYFGVGASALSLGQVATLVGMTRSPESYEPRRHPERARVVRGVVLDLLVTEGLIDAGQASAAEAEELAVIPLEEATQHLTERNHLTAMVTRELRTVAPEFSGRQGLTVHTTLDQRIQRGGEEALESQLAAIESGRFGDFEASDSSTHLEGASVALDPVDGSILAWVGGRDFARSQFDRVDQGRRQVGSLVKPLLVALALERGYGIADMVSADTVLIPTSEGGWLPADHVLETELPLREALIRSSNRAAAHLGIEVGLESIEAVGHRAGLTGSIPALPSTSIGAFESSLLEMTSAYSVFGNRGLRMEPHVIERIEAADGSVLWQRPESSEPTRVLDEATAFVTLDAMRAVVDRGTGTSVRGFGYRGPAAGKTGTTNDGRDAWFIGLTPDVVAGVWIGFDTPRPIVDDRGGGALAAPAWALWMRGISAVLPPRRAWVPPPSVERVQYHVQTGEVIGPQCQGGIAAGYQEAWVHTGRYDRRRCPDDGIRGWMGRLWRAIAPPPVAPVGARRRPPGG